MTENLNPKPEYPSADDLIALVWAEEISDTDKWIAQIMLADLIFNPPDDPNVRPDQAAKIMQVSVAEAEKRFKQLREQGYMD